MSKSFNNVKIKVSYANKKVNNTLPTVTLPTANQNINDTVGIIMTYLNELGNCAFKNIDSTVTSNSTNPVSSAAVYAELGNINTVLEIVLGEV